MPKLTRFKVTIETGDVGMDEPVHFNINSHKVPFEDVRGSAQAGQTFEGGFEINSFAHSLTLVGPETGQWNIKKLKVDLDLEGAEPYSVTFGEVALDETNEVNIWRDPPVPTFDV